VKIKQTPDDFQVEELTHLTARVQNGTSATGPYAFYRLHKQGWTTPDALQVIRRRWDIDHRRMHYGGLKDRHASTIQYFTILNGPQRNLTHQRLAVEYLGQLPEAYSSTDILANRFCITLRGLTDQELPTLVRTLEEVKHCGVPNYFDDQRFGSVDTSSDPPEFVARAMIRGEFEQGLKLALTAPYEHDRAADKAIKQLLRQHWGDWPELKARLPRSHARSLVDYLVSHPTDFRGALLRVRPELRGLYLSAYQSYLWNRILARWLTTHLPPEQLGELVLRIGRLPTPRAVPPELLQQLHTLELPLPSARLRLADDDPHAALIRQVVAEEGFAVESMRIRGMDKPYFSRGLRRAMIVPTNVSYRSGEDTLNRNRQCLTIKFDLPRGAYATMLIKRLNVSAADRLQVASGL